MPTSDSAETERVIRQRLEASGQYGKMRAMIMEAALQTVQSSATSSADAAAAPNSRHPLFTPSAALTKAKEEAERGAIELSVVLDYLQSLGLQYTESVLRLEAGLAAVPLQSSAELRAKLGVPAAETCLSALVRSGGGGGGGAVTGSGAAELAAVDSSVGKDHSDAVDDDAASDHDQPGGEDSTYFISSWKKRHFVRCGQVSGQQVQLDRLTDCQVVVLDELDSMTADECEGGELIIAACEGSVFLRNCKNMTVHVACKQLRTRDCENIELHIFTTTDPVVEMSHHMHFYPFHLRLPHLRQRFAEARLDAKLNRFVHVYDFTPSEPDLPQPHFTVHFPDHGQSMEDRFDSYGPLECPPELEQLLALQLMPAASSESGKNKSYDIKTGAQVWATAGVAAAATAAAAVPAAAATAPSANGEASGKPPVFTAAKAAGNGTANASYQDDFDASGSEHSSVHSSSVSDVPDSEEGDESDSSGSSSSGGGVGQQGNAGQRKVGGAAVVPAAVTAGGHAATPGGLDNEEYSSFDDDDDSDGQDADDKYEVDEDEDDF